MMRSKPKHTRLLDNLASHMRDRRKALGMTQEQLAEKSGLSWNYVARLEISDATPSFGTLISLSKALEIEASDLLAGEEARPWMDKAQEIARIMESLDRDDSQFVLHQVQSVVSYLKSRHKNEE